MASLAAKRQRGIHNFTKCLDSKPSAGSFAVKIIEITNEIFCPHLMSPINLAFFLFHSLILSLLSDLWAWAFTLLKQWNSPLPNLLFRCCDHREFPLKERRAASRGGTHEIFCWPQKAQNVYSFWTPHSNLGHTAK